jgi:uncharacterized protein
MLSTPHTMNLLVMTDLHGRLSMLTRALAEAGPVDAAVLAGDITDFGGSREMKQSIDAIRERVGCVLAVHGNCDRPKAAEYLLANGVGLHRRGVVVNGIGFFGVGRSLPCPGTTPSETDDETLGRDLDAAFGHLEPGIPSVMVSHEPPVNTRMDLAWGSVHVGSAALRLFIEKHQPLICFCGHIHEASGQDAIGATRVVNAGPLRDGCYALARIENGAVTSVDMRCVATAA